MCIPVIEGFSRQLGLKEHYMNIQKKLETLELGKNKKLK